MISQNVIFMIYPKLQIIISHNLMDKYEKLQLFKYIWNRADAQTKEQLRFLLEREAISRGIIKNIYNRH